MSGPNNEEEKPRVTGRATTAQMLDVERTRAGFRDVRDVIARRSRSVRIDPGVSPRRSCTCQCHSNPQASCGISACCNDSGSALFDQFND